MRSFDTEIASIRAIGSVTASALALVNSIAGRIEVAVEAFKQGQPDVDTSELDAAIAEARSNADALAAAVVANTSQAGTDGQGIAPGSGSESTGQAPQADSTQTPAPLTEADQNQG